MLYLSLFCVIILHLTGIVYCYEACSPSGLYYTYCEDGTYCCHNDRDCCSGLTVGGIIGVVCGVVVAIASCAACVCCCVRQQRTRAAQGQVVGQQQQATVMYTTSAGQMQTGYALPPSYSQTQYGVQPPYPVYSQGQPAPAYYANPTVPDTSAEIK